MTSVQLVETPIQLATTQVELFVTYIQQLLTQAQSSAGPVHNECTSKAYTLKGQW